MISLQSVSIKLGNKKILSDISMTVEEGASLGLVGANGSGKSVLLSIIAGLLRPTQGHIERSHAKNVDGKLTSTVSLVSGAPLGFYPRLTGEENLRFFCYLVGEKPNNEQVKWAFERTGLAAADRYKPYAAYSLGMKQRLHFARALLQKPWLVLMDEPTNGLDENGRNRLISILNEDFSSVSRIVSSHDSEFLSLTTKRRITVANGGIQG